jgi:hypothetical protein
MTKDEKNEAFRNSSSPSFSVTSRLATIAPGHPDPCPKHFEKNSNQIPEVNVRNGSVMERKFLTIKLKFSTRGRHRKTEFRCLRTANSNSTILAL